VNRKFAEFSAIFSFLAAHFAKRNMKFGSEKNWHRKARAGKNSFPPTPFLFARPTCPPKF
jgi:hypothetical protein